MEVSCTSCPARFAVPDDKVRGRKVRITCKRCGSPIVVDGTHLEAGARQSAPGPESAKAAPKPAPAPAPKPAVAAAKPAVAAAKPASALAKPATAPSATARPAVAPKPAPAPLGAPKPAPAAAPASTPKPGTAPRAKPAGAGGDWAALESEGKAGAWREPAAATPPGQAIRRTMIGGMEAPPGAPRPPPASVPRPDAGAPAPPRPGPPAPQPTAKSSKQTMLGLAPPSSAQAIPPIAPIAPAPRSQARLEPPSQRVSLSDATEVEPEWTVALTDEQHEEMRTPEVVELYVRGSIDHETFIWADGMEDWKRAWEIPMIATALAARGMRQPSADDEPRAMQLSDAEPDEEEATIVASVDMLPSSGRGKIPSGVWREPGRDQPEDEVGFEDVTVTIDSAKARGMLRDIGHEPGALHESEPPPSEDVPTRVEQEEAPADGFGGGVDDLLAGMEDPTNRFGRGGFQAVSRPLHSVADFHDDDDTTIDQQSRAPALPNPNAELYAPNVADLALPSPLDYQQHPVAPPQNLFAGVDVPSYGRSEPLDSLLGADQRTAPEVFAPPASDLARPKKKSRLLGCMLTLFVFGLLLAAGAGASFYLKQPASLYGPDGRPKVPEMLRQYL